MNENQDKVFNKTSINQLFSINLNPYNKGDDYNEMLSYDIN